MDPAIAWFQEEQEGPSKQLWLSIWDTIQEMEIEQQQQQQANNSAIMTHNNSTSRTGKCPSNWLFLFVQEFRKHG